MKFVNDSVTLKRKTGGLEPRAQGKGGGHDKRGAVQSWITARLDAKPDLTLNDLVGELADQHGIAIHRVTVWRVLRGLGLTHRKDLQAVEQKRPEIRQARHIWITRRQPFMRNLLTRIGSIDETSRKTNMAKTSGWSPRGAPRIDHAPFGHWNTQTIIAALRHDRLEVPWLIDGGTTRDLFELCGETQLAPTLQPGEGIILDNRSSQKSSKAAATMKAVGAWFLFLPPDSPDLSRGFARSGLP